MKSLEFRGDITLEEVFNEHKAVIYESVVHAIRDNLKLSEPEVPVIKIIINEIEYSINLGHEKFLRCLDQAIAFYEQLEEYEKCQECLEISNNLRKKELV